MKSSLENKVVVITGAAGGLGEAFAKRFASFGAKIVVGDINLEKAQLVANELETSFQVEVIALKVNVTDEASTQDMASQIKVKWGKVDVLINNAAIYNGIQRSPFYEMEVDEWDRVMDVNLKGTWLTSKSLFGLMKVNGGSIINISSATFMSGSPNWSHYVASKGGVIGLTRSMAREIGDFNINVNAVAPGFTLTEASLSLMNNAASYGVNRGAIKRASESEDIVGAVVFFASEEAKFITGQTLVVDGGRQFL
ncbi:MAG: SDR family oxidoreductase [Bacteroidetes bacterium]|nr:SDR family oxidoreductase [Bacteroidota bacterium]